jgi:RTX calcium-binding nonapeptide repeat (4 copies)
MPTEETAMADTLRYIFYGGVEGAYQNTDLNDPLYLVSARGAAAFGYTEGQLLKGSISFSGAALDIVEAHLPPQPLTAIEIPIGTQGLDFFLAQPRVGNYTEADLIGIDDPIRNVVDVQFTGSPNDALYQLGLRLSGGPDGPRAFVDNFGATFIDDDEAQARADGVWLPESIVPDFKSGSSGNDKLSGNAAYNFLSGGSGNDTLAIKSGIGWAWGGNGNDTIKGSDGGTASLFGGDHLHGGAGSDRIYGGRGGDVIEGGGNSDDLRGEEGNDVVGGGVGNDTVRGGSGDDFLGGESGSDRLYGNDGVDDLDGGSGSDYLDGGSGNDFLIGRGGNDTLRGGPGSDVYSFGGGTDGHDTVYGFQAGIDTIHIAPSDPITFEQLIATAVVHGHDVTLTYGPGSSITFDHTALSSLRASDFDFV